MTFTLYKKVTSIFFLGLTFISFAQCKTIGNKVTQNSQSLQPIKLIQNKGVSKLNSDKTLELRLQRITKPGDPATHFQYKVYTTKTKAILKEGIFRGTDIVWNDARSLKLIHYVGMEQKPSSDNPDDILLSNSNAQITIIKIKN